MLYRSRFLPALVASSIIAATALGAVGVSAAATKSTPKKTDRAADTKLFKQLLAISSPKLTVASAKNAAHAKNADKLGGLAPSAFQLRVSHSCTASNAIQAIASDGTVSCQPTGTGTVTGVSADTCLTGGGNTAVGHQALSSHTTGGGNTALGLNALYNGSAGVTSGASDTAIGNYAGTGLTTGSGNTLLGQYAGSSLSGGDSNNLDLGN